MLQDTGHTNHGHDCGHDHRDEDHGRNGHSHHHNQKDQLSSGGCGSGKCCHTGGKHRHNHSHANGACSSSPSRRSKSLVNNAPDVVASASTATTVDPLRNGCCSSAHGPVPPPHVRGRHKAETNGGQQPQQQTSSVTNTKSGRKKKHHHHHQHSNGAVPSYEVAETLFGPSQHYHPHTPTLESLIMGVTLDDPDRHVTVGRSAADIMSGAIPLPPASSATINGTVEEYEWENLFANNLSAAAAAAAAAAVHRGCDSDDCKCGEYLMEMRADGGTGEPYVEVASVSGAHLHGHAMGRRQRAGRHGRIRHGAATNGLSHYATSSAAGAAHSHPAPPTGYGSVAPPHDHHHDHANCHHGHHEAYDHDDDDEDYDDEDDDYTDEEEDDSDDESYDSEGSELTDGRSSTTSTSTSNLPPHVDGHGHVHRNGGGANGCNPSGAAAGSNRSNSGVGLGDGGRVCDCCYCEVFGHGMPVMPPTNSRYTEIRERMLSKLKERKQKRNGGGSSPPPPLSGCNGHSHSHGHSPPSGHHHNHHQQSGGKNKLSMAELSRQLQDQFERQQNSKKKTIPLPPPSGATSKSNKKGADNVPANLSIEELVNFINGDKPTPQQQSSKSKSGKSAKGASNGVAAAEKFSTSEKSKSANKETVPAAAPAAADKKTKKDKSKKSSTPPPPPPSAPKTPTPSVASLSTATVTVTSVPSPAATPAKSTTKSQAPNNTAVSVTVTAAPQVQPSLSPSASSSTNKSKPVTNSNQKQQPQPSTTTKPNVSNGPNSKQTAHQHSKPSALSESVPIVNEPPPPNRKAKTPPPRKATTPPPAAPPKVEVKSANQNQNSAKKVRTAAASNAAAATGHQADVKTKNGPAPAANGLPKPITVSIPEAAKEKATNAKQKSVSEPVSIKPVAAPTQKTSFAKENIANNTTKAANGPQQPQPKAQSPPASKNHTAPNSPAKSKASSPPRTNGDSKSPARVSEAASPLSSPNGKKDRNKRKKGHEDGVEPDEVFMPKDIDLDNGELDEAEKELEAWKRTCFNTRPRGDRIKLNLKDFNIKKKAIILGSS